MSRIKLANTALGILCCDSLPLLVCVIRLHSIHGGATRSAERSLLHTHAVTRIYLRFHLASLTRRTVAPRTD